MARSRGEGTHARQNRAGGAILRGYWLRRASAPLGRPCGSLESSNQATHRRAQMVLDLQPPLVCRLEALGPATGHLAQIDAAITAVAVAASRLLVLQHFGLLVAVKDAAGCSGRFETLGPATSLLLIFFTPSLLLQWPLRDSWSCNCAVSSSSSACAACCSGRFETLGPATSSWTNCCLASKS